VTDHTEVGRANSFLLGRDHLSSVKVTDPGRCAANKLCRRSELH
jgi:hypothetical protein